MRRPRSRAPTSRPWRAIDSVAASSSRTTRRPASPSVVGVAPSADAVDEVRRLDAERLGHGQLRRPHVAGAVADEHLIDVLGARVHRDAAVVDLDLLAAPRGRRTRPSAGCRRAACAAPSPATASSRARARSGCSRRTSSCRRCSRGWPGTCASPVADTATGCWSQHVVHDRQIVDGQVPQHVDVVLEQAEVDADRVVVVDVAELAGLRSARASCGRRRCRRRCGRPSARAAAPPPRRSAGWPARSWTPSASRPARACRRAAPPSPARSACSTGVAMTTASTAGSSHQRPRRSVVTVIAGIAALRPAPAARAAGRTPRARAAPRHSAKLRTRFGPQ